MKKVLLFFAVILPAAMQAQNVFTYGNYSVGKEEFLRAFNKNNNGSGASRQDALKEYLELYSNFKLKVQAAKDMQLDTMPNQKADYRNFRRQIEDNYMNDEAMLGQMVKEAFDRTQSDLRISHITIPVKEGEDTSAAFAAINQAYKELKNGKAFAEVAKQYSKEADVANTGGDLGYITAFSLPYEFESLIYNTAVDSYSAPYHSKGGYHLFKVTDKRKALGRIKVAQVFFVFSPDMNPADKKALKEKADSVYEILKKKDLTWGEAVANYSQDRNTMYLNGELAEFGIGEYDPVFESTAYALTKADDISKPFATNYGYHILRLVEKIPVESDWQKVFSAGALKQKVTVDPRAQIAKNKFTATVLKSLSIKNMPYDEKSLWQFTDSFVLNNAFSPVGKLTEKTILFSFPKQDIRSVDFAMYARTLRNSGTPSAAMPYADIMKSYREITALEYYRNHLEEYNKDFKYQLQEFREGNLLFEIMEKNVWNKAVVDSAGQAAYYAEHKNLYKWQSSIGALIITGTDKESANSFRDYLTKNGLTSWRKKAEEYNGKIIVDSGRFEKSQVPVPERTAFSKGLVTSPVVNAQDGSSTFAFVTEVYADNEQRSLDESRGMVINDYQTVLEEKWLKELKKKYPVKTDEKVWNELLNQK